MPLVGVKANGSRRWLGVGGLTLQPSELAKYAIILYLARALSRKNRDVTRLFTGLAPLFILPGLVFMLILLQPNLSTAGSILIVTAVMVMIAGARWRHQLEEALPVARAVREDLGHVRALRPQVRDPQPQPQPQDWLA